MKTSPLVLVTEGSDSAPLAWLKERARVIEAAPDTPDFNAALSEVEGMVVRTYTRVNEGLLARCPRLKVVGRGGVGLENIDVAACRARNVEVVFTPDANTLAVGDFVIGYALQLLRPWAFFKDNAYEPKEFKRIRDTQRGVQLNELTLGILGMGRVGRRVGSIAANGFGMRVMDDAVLADLLRRKKIAGAAIDVFDPEPPKSDYPLLGLDNVLLTPHMAARTRTAIENMSWVVRDVVEVLEGRKPKYPAP